LARNQLGVWCGYVGVPLGHPVHGQDHEKVHVEVHGGLTFSGTYTRQCGFYGEPADVWWLGFDCGHGYDYLPGFQSLTPQMMPYGDPANYKTIAYAQAEVERLALQLSKLPWQCN